MLKKALVLLISIITLTSCASDGANESNKTGELEKYQNQIYDTFDTVITFTTYQEKSSDFEKYAKIVKDEFERYNKLFDNYKSYNGINNIYTINENAGEKEVKVDPEIIEVLELSKEYYDKTNGDVNVALGSVLEIWHNYREDAIANPDDAKIPTNEELENASKHTNIDDIVIDKKKSSVYIKDKGTKIDLGAIAKGFATERVRKKLEDAGMKNGIISAGGNVVTIGENPSSDDGKWKIAIKNPDEKSEENYANVLELKEAAIVTSGDYQRFYEYNGKRYNHIVDPKTLMPAENFTSVTIITDNSAKADALSTALFIKTEEDGRKLLEQEKADALWIDKDYNQTKTDTLKTER